MDFYVASAWSDRARAAALIAELERRGHRCTYNWTTQDEQLGKDVAAMTEISEQEFAAVAGAVAGANVFIFLLPGARGSHVEFGIALAAGAITYVVGTPEQRTGPYGVPCGFHHLADFQYETVEQVVRTELLSNAALAEPPR